MRAVSITLPLQSAAPNGLLKAGHYVDVYLTPRIDAANDARLQGGMTVTLFRGVRLLATSAGESFDQPSDEPSGLVTLELTPEQATVLILAREKGHLALSYNPEGKGDGGVALKNSDRATFDEILGVPTAAPSSVGPSSPAPTSAGPAAAAFTAEVYKGSVRSTRQFEGRSKNEVPPAAAAPVGASRNIPVWARRSPAKPVPVHASDRFAAGPDGATVRQ
jgi:pilus assembly protein CpaB